jgi:hypothetical protein
MLLVKKAVFGVVAIVEENLKNAPNATGTIPIVKTISGSATNVTMSGNHTRTNAI